MGRRSTPNIAAILLDAEQRSDKVAAERNGTTLAQIQEWRAESADGPLADAVANERQKRREQWRETAVVTFVTLGRRIARDAAAGNDIPNGIVQAARIFAAAAQAAEQTGMHPSSSIKLQQLEITTGSLQNLRQALAAIDTDDGET
jgi:hypothetical protein